MPSLPEKNEQIVQAHAGLIHRVVMACQNRSIVPDLEDILKQAADNGWTELVAALRNLLAGGFKAGREPALGGWLQPGRSAHGSRQRELPVPG